MNHELVEKIAEAVLYEGYMLYPYRPCVKTRCRWNFGGVFPAAYCQSHDSGDNSFMQCQCLAQASPEAQLQVRVRFLHLQQRAGDSECEPWQEAVERSVDAGAVRLGDLTRRPWCRLFSFPQVRQAEDGIVREQRAIQGVLNVSCEKEAKNLYRLTVRVDNQTPITCARRDEALLQAFASTHMILKLSPGGFVSMTDPPRTLRTGTESCRNAGCWPILVGRPGDTDTLLASPIILEDYPQIAPQSPGNLFDGTEIDEILTLRVMTLTDEEKQQAAAVDPRARDLLERTENLGREQFMNLHGLMHAAPHPGRPSGGSP